MRKYRGKVVRVVDGDTVDFDFDLGFYMTARIRTRLLYINTPERGKADFQLATDLLATMLKDITDEEGYVEIDVHKTGKFGRWLVEIDNINKTLGERWPYDNEK